MSAPTLPVPPFPPDMTPEQWEHAVQFWIRDTSEVRTRLTAAHDEMAKMRELLKATLESETALKLEVAGLRNTLSIIQASVALWTEQQS